MMTGKGDSYRPVNQKVYGENYDAIFRKGTHEQQPADQASEVLPEPCPRCGFSRCTAGEYFCSEAPRQAGDDNQAAGPE
jgi:hypothetical protein